MPEEALATSSWDGATVERFLEETRIPVRLACNGASGFPVLASLWFQHGDGALWCATRPDADIVGHLSRDPRCAFEVAGDQPPYRGVRGSARVEIDEQRGKSVLEQLIQRYLGDVDAPLARWLLARADGEVALRVEPVRLTSWDYSPRMTSN